MILGIGEDICDIRRLEAVLDTHGERFLERIFTASEQAKAATRHGKHEPAATLAKRFAAKEACVKAMGTGVNHGIYMRDIGVINTPTGAPTLKLTGNALAHLKSMAPNANEIKIHLTLSDEYPYARAFVIIEAL